MAMNELDARREFEISRAFEAVFLVACFHPLSRKLSLPFSKSQSLPIEMRPGGRKRACREEFNP